MKRYLGAFFSICSIIIFFYINSFYCITSIDTSPVRIKSHVVNKVNDNKEYDVTIIIPYMNREQHRTDFLKYMANYTSSRYPDKRILVIVSEQGDSDLPFSRSWTFNAGYLYYREHYRSPCVVIHDVDRFPCPETDTVPYFKCSNPMHLSSENMQWKWGVPYRDFVGGVLNMSPNHWERVNGMHNGYRAWGGEDDDLSARMKHVRLPKLTRPIKGSGRFCDFPRKSKDHSANYSKKHYKNNLKLLKKTQKEQGYYREDGLNTFNGTMTSIMIDNMTYSKFHIIQLTNVL